MGESDGNLELLTECGSVPEAYGVRAFLEESGIPCLVQGEHTVMILGRPAMESNVRVLVSPENLPRAKELLAALNDGENALPDDADVSELEPTPEE